MPNQPWLGAPNFGYETARGDSGELKDYRDRQPVLLVLASLPESAARLRDLATQAADLLAQDLVILVVLMERRVRQRAAQEFRPLLCNPRACRSSR